MKEQLDEVLKLQNEMFGLVDQITEKMTPEFRTYLAQHMHENGYCNDDAVYKVVNFREKLYDYFAFQYFKSFDLDHLKPIKIKE
jgi:hypothetical protein